MATSNINNDILLYLLILSACLLVWVKAQTKPSPCPEMFRYLPKNPQEKNKWYGELNIVSDVDLIDGVFIVLLFDKNTLQLGSSFGKEIIKKSDTEFLLRNFGFELSANKPLKIQIYVVFNEFDTDPPNLVGFRSYETTTPTWKTDQNIQIEALLKQVGLLFPRSSTSIPEIPKKYETSSNEYFPKKNGHHSGQCGQVIENSVPLIFNGERALPGEFPWHAALYVMTNNPPQLLYICGGTLISNRHVLTAAHCVYYKEPKELKVTLGTTDLFKYSNTVQDRLISNIAIHEHYQKNRNHNNDIAILKLLTPVEYTNHVRPACLWSQSSDLLDNEIGVVPGYGLMDIEHFSFSLKRAHMPAISVSTCILAGIEYANLLTDKKYCAGYRNGTSACNGDSGGGMMFRRKISASTYIWEIRGIISLSLSTPNTGKCNPYNYIVVTDVAKYLNWVIETVNSY